MLSTPCRAGRKTKLRIQSCVYMECTAWSSNIAADITRHMCLSKHVLADLLAGHHKTTRKLWLPQNTTTACGQYMALALGSPWTLSVGTLCRWSVPPNTHAGAFGSAVLTVWSQVSIRWYSKALHFPLPHLPKDHGAEPAAGQTGQHMLAPIMYWS